MRRVVIAILTAAALSACAARTTHDTDGAAVRVIRPTDPVDRPGRMPAAPPASTQATHEAAETSPSPLAGDGRPRDAVVSIPAIGLRDLTVEAYPGRTDDDRGTAIQDGGHAASPYGSHGGVGPGGIGNFQVTAHRTSASGPFLDLPSLRSGDRVLVTDRSGTRYTYRITHTRSTSFRSARSLAEQRAAVPGHPGRVPTRAMITLSTCATQEDHAAGNWWADEHHNPEHRIDKVGVLIAITPASGPSA